MQSSVRMLTVYINHIQNIIKTTFRSNANIGFLKRQIPNHVRLVGIIKYSMNVLGLFRVSVVVMYACKVE